MMDEIFRQHGKDLYTQLKACAGASIGSIFALYTVLGVRGKRLYKDVMSQDTQHVLTEMNIDSLTSMYGLNDGMYMRRQIRNILETYAENADITFQELYQFTGKMFTCSITNVSAGQTEYHNYINTPEYPVYLSVTASMSIPFIFAPVIINGDYFIDGAITDNIPFNGFPIDKSIIFSLDGNLPNITGLQSYSLRIALIGFRMYLQQRLSHLPNELRNRCIRLRVDELTSLSFNADIETKKQVIFHGIRVIGRLLFPELFVEECVNVIKRSLVLALRTPEVESTE